MLKNILYGQFCLEAVVFYYFFTEIGPWSSSLALLVVVMIPALFAVGATVRAARRG